MKKTISTTAAIGTLMVATPAFADGAAHSHGFFANVIHWMSSPAHGFFTVVALIAVGAATKYLLAKKA